MVEVRVLLGAGDVDYADSVDWSTAACSDAGFATTCWTAVADSCLAEFGEAVADALS